MGLEYQMTGFRGVWDELTAGEKSKDEFMGYLEMVRLLPPNRQIHY
jgi:hypothetical protein